MFKVVPDQLRISDGWVRCGQCEEIFDASANLQEPAEVVLPQAQAPDSAAADESVDVSANVAIDLDLGQALVAEEDSVPTLALPAQRPVPPGAGVEEFSESGEGDSAESEPAVLPEAPVTSMHDEAQRDGQPPPAQELPEPSFMRQASRRSAAAAPGRRVALLSGVVVLCLAWLLQGLVHERDRLAAMAPGLTPLIEGVCAQVGCRVAPLRQIEAVLIESASFTKVRTDVFRLSLTLRNSALTDLALPAIELSLTDSQDRTLLRRAFLAAELGLSTEVLTAGSETAVSLLLGVENHGNAERIAGYRVLAFYP